MFVRYSVFFFFFQAEDGIRDLTVTGVQTCALPICGDLQRARDFYTRAKPFRERSGDVVGFAVDQTNLGAVTFSLGDFAGARRAWEAALPAARSLGEAEGAALILSNLAGLAQREGDYTDAAARANEALSIYRERGNRVYEAQVLVNLGRLAMMREI